MSRITTILLDLDDTILHDGPATDRAFAAAGQRANEAVGVDPDRLNEAAIRVSKDLWAKGPFPEWCHAIGTGPLEGLRADFLGDDTHWQEMRTWGPGFRHDTWRAALLELDVDDDALAAELDATFKRERDAANIFMDGADAALTELATRYRLGMVTNGIPDVQRIKIDRTGLAERFDHITVSGEIGVGKPEPGIYEWTLEQMGISADEAIMVGDNYRRDVCGGQDAGIRSVWLSLGRERPGAIEPWLTIDLLRDLPAALREHEL